MAVVTALAMAGAGWALLPGEAGSRTLADYLASFLWTASGLALGYFGVGMLVRPPTALVIDRQGITVRTPTSLEAIRWCDLKSAHLAVVETPANNPRVRTKIVALELVDPRAFYARLDAGKPQWLGSDIGLRPDYYPLVLRFLDGDVSRLLDVLKEGIRRQGRPNPEPDPRTVYQAIFHRPPGRRGLRRFFATMAVIIGLIVTTVIRLAPPTWIAVGPDCDVRNLYGGKQWRQAKTTTATWTGPCTNGRADGSGVLEWFRNGRLTWRYEGEMSRGRVTGRGELTEWKTKYVGAWKNAELEEGIAIYPDGRRYEGRWYNKQWSKGVLTAFGRRMEGRWSADNLTGWGVAEGPEGRYEGYWNNGRPQGTGTFVAADGERYDGKWRDGQPVDPTALGPQSLERLPCLWSIAYKQHGSALRARC